MMPPRDLLLIAIVVIAWGTNFTAMALALDHLPPLLFVGLRFAILVPLILVFPRPASWMAILGVGALLNMGQFGFLFSAMEADISAGLASLILQSQAPLTILLAAIFFKEPIRGLQILGIAIAIVGLTGFGLSAGGNVTLLGLALVLCGATCWACGNLVLRRLPGVNMVALFAWASLVPPVPMLAASWATEGPAPLATIANLPLSGWAAVLYVAIMSTVLGYALWGTLLSRHEAAKVTPFALLIPVVGIATAAILLGERLTTFELMSGGVILVGVALAVLGARAPSPR